MFRQFLALPDHYDAVDILKAAGDLITMKIEREVFVNRRQQQTGSSPVENGHGNDSVSLSSLSQVGSNHSQKSLGLDKSARANSGPLPLPTAQVIRVFNIQRMPVKFNRGWSSNSRKDSFGVPLVVLLRLE